MCLAGWHNLQAIECNKEAGAGYHVSHLWFSAPLLRGMAWERLATRHSIIWRKLRWSCCSVAYHKRVMWSIRVSSVWSLKRSERTEERSSQGKGNHGLGNVTNLGAKELREISRRNSHSKLSVSSKSTDYLTSMRLAAPVPAPASSPITKRFSSRGAVCFFAS
jgi:hypothetical protein